MRRSAPGRSRRGRNSTHRVAASQEPVPMDDLDRRIRAASAPATAASTFSWRWPVKRSAARRWTCLHCPRPDTRRHSFKSVLRSRWHPICTSSRDPATVTRPTSWSTSGPGYTKTVHSAMVRQAMVRQATPDTRPWRHGKRTSPLHSAPALRGAVPATAQGLKLRMVRRPRGESAPVPQHPRAWTGRVVR